MSGIKLFISHNYHAQGAIIELFSYVYVLFTKMFLKIFGIFFCDDPK